MYIIVKVIIDFYGQHDCHNISFKWSFVEVIGDRKLSSELRRTSNRNWFRIVFWVKDFLHRGSGGKTPPRWFTWGHVRVNSHSVSVLPEPGNSLQYDDCWYSKFVGLVSHHKIRSSRPDYYVGFYFVLYKSTYIFVYLKQYKENVDLCLPIIATENYENHTNCSDTTIS